ncbi:MAG: hypothetical protein KDK36_18865 [Leptospiraceae bacterium]|nr:hypothetical protein [Leptospiraceae bacterium]
MRLLLKNEKVNQNKLLGLRLSKRTDSKIRRMARKQNKTINLFCSELIESKLEDLEKGGIPA